MKNVVLRGNALLMGSINHDEDGSEKKVIVIS